MPGKSCTSPINSASKARANAFPPALLRDIHAPNPSPMANFFAPPAKEPGHSNQLPIDKGPKYKIVSIIPHAISDGFQSHSVMLGHRVRKGQRLPLQRFQAKLLVSLRIEFGQAANFHGPFSVNSSLSSVRPDYSG